VVLVLVLIVGMFAFASTGVQHFIQEIAKNVLGS
jgi:hypothetical protein